jgi:cytochrome c556
MANKKYNGFSESEKSWQEEEKLRHEKKFSGDSERERKRTGDYNEQERGKKEYKSALGKKCNSCHDKKKM